MRTLVYSHETIRPARQDYAWGLGFFSHEPFRYADEIYTVGLEAAAGRDKRLQPLVLA